jgi:UDP-N-acetyl-D-glucosamine dehydrogenase
MHPLLHRIHDRDARVVVVGQGYVGLVVAVHAAEAGFPTAGFELNQERVDWLRDGRSYIEDISDDRLQANLNGTYRPTGDPADLEGFEVGVISVPTPLHEGLPDLRAVESAARTLGRALSRGALVVLESTTYPGTTEELVRSVLEAESGLTAGEDFLLGYSPERIDPGNTVNTLATTPKVVSGIDDESLAAVAAFFGSFVADVVEVSSPAVAELTKVLENTFRHVNIALVNELARFAADLGVDIWEAIDAASTKPFGFMPFRPGPGVGGHCLPVDPTYLSWRVKRQLNEAFRFIDLANDVNDHMPLHVTQRIQALLNRHKLPVNGTRIVVLGLAYKPNTSDARETPAVPVMEQLRALGADVTVVDPLVPQAAVGDGIAHVATIDEAGIDDADLVVLVTDHDSFDYDAIGRRSRLIFDTRNRFPRSERVEIL